MTSRIFAFDIDGTLYNSHHEVLPSTRQGLRQLQQQGDIVMIASGRSLAQARPVINDLHLDSYISCNGAAAFVHGKCIYKNMMDKAQLSDLLQAMNALGLDMSFVTLEHSYRSHEHYGASLDEATASFGEGIPEYRPFEEIDEEICQALIYCPEDKEQLLDPYRDRFRFVRWHRHAVDVLPLNSSKAHTLVKVAEHLQQSMNDVYAFGDGNNDYEMLQTVGHGVAMGNAVQRTKDIAEYVTDTCDQDGIYKALQHYQVIK